MFDYHMHSNFSADCSTPMEKTIETAIERGLTEICFTEHVDFDYPDPSISFDLDLERYERKIMEMKQQYGGAISIKKGVEIGVEPHLLARYKKLIDTNRFDFIICSMHTSERKDLHSGSFFAGKTVEEAYQIYYEELLYCVTHFKDYNVLGHVDLVKRYTKQKSKLDFHDLLQQIFKQVIADGRGIELNTSGFRYGLNSGMPSTDILKLYKDCGGEILTLGSDSHVERTVGYGFKEALELLQSIGFSYITTFSERKPSFHPITQLI
ncbi:histidinol-phosphatase HisJ family protein [Oceanobacillus manasiensis]|uniref:histidinol-phosphatase HisJ family protein n=1 Tax=Oceanobacillus manasiensis TaxID=586413 RepID=UPI0005A78160|nr:histidinol-phosphatase HisJ family protein [Oceanobacillus manasiensis]